MLCFWTFIFTIISSDVIVQGDENICSDILLTEPTGIFTSPNYPSRYPSNAVCEWLIEVEPGYVIEIKFEDLAVGTPYPASIVRNDYVQIHESELDSEGEYFHQSHPSFPNIKKTYRSKTNSVSILFLTDGKRSYRGFKASYESWDATNYCEKNSLGENGSVDFYDTRCRNESKHEFYAECDVVCHVDYVMKKNSKVTCQNGKFVPEKLCDLVPLEVQLCENTNMEYCHYTVNQLVEYWATKNADSEISEETATLLDQFPDPQESNFGAIGSRSRSRTAKKTVKANCFDKLIKSSYCEKRKEKYAFQCQEFSKIKRLKKAVVKRKVDACFQCRKVSCSSTVLIYL